jgi:hypothetical protein
VKLDRLDDLSPTTCILQRRALRVSGNKVWDAIVWTSLKHGLRAAGCLVDSQFCSVRRGKLNTHMDTQDVQCENHGNSPGRQGKQDVNLRLW